MILNKTYNKKTNTVKNGNNKQYCNLFMILIVTGKYRTYQKHPK